MTGQPLDPLGQSPDPVSRLREIAARLRAPDGCPWDREQTHASMRAALIEETYEVLAAIDAADDANFQEELGDLLLHVVMHSQMAQERGAFSLDEVAAGIGDKMVRRHPHVFGADGPAADSAAVLTRWDEIKRREKGDKAPTSRMAGLMDGLPALMRAQKAQEKAARAGFDWQAAADVLAKVREEVQEVEEAAQKGAPGAIEEEIGDLLFSAVNLARWHKLDAELVLQRATSKFVGRFQRVERALEEAGRRWEDATPEELDALWERIKEQPAH